MSTIISKMKYDDIWCTDDICAVLSEHNSEIGDECFFRELLYSAKKSEKIKAINEPMLILEHSEEYRRYNFEYKKEEIIAWILSKSWVLHILPNKNTSPKIESVNMNIIAGLLMALLGSGANLAKNSRFKDQSSLIDYLEANFKSNLEGMSKRTLEGRFAEANKILKQLGLEIT